MSPKLFRPLVDVDVRPDGTTWGEGWRSASIALFNDPIVEDRPLEPRKWGGTGIDGVDFADRCDVIESFRKRDGPAATIGALVRATRECVGDGKGDACLEEEPLCGFGANIAVTGSSIRVCPRTGDVDIRPLLESFGVLSPSVFESEGRIFIGSGKRCPLFFFRRGKRKNVVVVETVCVVVVSA